MYLKFEIFTRFIDKKVPYSKKLVSDPYDAP